MTQKDSLDYKLKENISRYSQYEQDEQKAQSGDDVKATQFTHTDLPMSKWNFLKQTVIYSVKRIMADDLTKTASSLAYTTVLATVPLLTVILAIFTAFPIFNEFKVYLDDFLAHNLFPEAISDNILKYLNEFAQSASQMSAVSLLFLMVTSIMLMMTIEEALNKIFRVSKPRQLGLRILTYWAVLTLGPILFSASLWISGKFISETMNEYLAVSSRILGVLIPWMLTTIGLTLLYYAIPNRRIAFKDALIGGVIAATLFEILKGGFAFYITKFPSYTLIYGAFAAVPLFLMWVYISWIIVLLGALITSIAPQVKLGHYKTHYEAGLRLMLSVQILRDLYGAQTQAKPGVDSKKLSKHLRIDPGTLTKLLDELQNLGFIVQVEGESDSWALTCNDHTDLTPILDRIMFNDQIHNLENGRELITLFVSSISNNKPVLLSDVLTLSESVHAKN